MSEREEIPVKISVYYQTNNPRMFHFGTWSRNKGFPSHYLVPAKIWEKHYRYTALELPVEDPKQEDCRAELDQLRLDIANLLLKYVRPSDENA